MDRVTKEGVAHVRGDLDARAVSDEAKGEGWFLARKTALTPVIPVEGPLTVETQEGEYELPEGWVGYIAVDKAGFPYPIEGSEFDSTYVAA